MIQILMLGMLFSADPYFTNIRVHDGDTITADIPNIPEVFGKDIGIRINGIDCAELHDQDPRVREVANKAKDFTAQKIKDAKKITITNIKRDKYFRLVADINIDDVNLAAELKLFGLAVPYDGKTKSPWMVE